MHIATSLASRTPPVARAAVVILLVTVTGALGVWAVRSAVGRGSHPAGTGSAAPDRYPGRYTEVLGVVHVHTTHSDGDGTVGDVLEAAKAADLDFVIITDHNTFDAKPLEGYSDDLLTIVGVEISTDAGHILGLGLDEPTFRFPDDPLDVLRDIDDLGGAAIVAHPASPRPEFRWTASELPGAWGMEVMNGDSEWRTVRPLRLLSTVLRYPFNQPSALARMLNTPATATVWDGLLAERRVPGLLGTDAHTRWPSYESVFRVARNHVVLDGPLAGESAADIATIADALMTGRVFVGVDAIAPTAGFFFIAERDGQTWTISDAVPPEPPPRLIAGGLARPDATVTLLKDGAIVSSGLGSVTTTASGSGVYRVEVTLPGWTVPWITTNPIYVFAGAELERRDESARLPPPEAAAMPRALLGRFKTDRTFATASDPSSSVSLTTVDDDEQAGSVARVDFDLREGSAAPFVAVTNFEQRDLSDYEGLSVALKADGVYRLWMQVRDRNPRSFEATEWWSASLKATREWQRLAVPFRNLRSRDPDSDGRLDLQEVEAVLFMINSASVPENTAGTLWLGDVGLY